MGSANFDADPTRGPAQKHGVGNRSDLAHSAATAVAPWVRICRREVPSPRARVLARAALPTPILQRDDQQCVDLLKLS